MNRQLLLALLTGGVLAFSLGCAKKGTAHLPTGPDQLDGEVRVPPRPVVSDPDAEAAAAAEAAFRNAVRDPATDGFVEVGRRDETAPLGRQVPEFANVEFDFDSDALTAEGRSRLDKALVFLRENPKTGIVLRGHTDSSGTEEYNLVLGSRRAQAVRNYLLERGIAPGRVETVSFGKMVPLADEDTPAARARNRRVELFLFELN
ncbi:MAG: OmpA family protein [Candidatus Sumerlaeia bacterium]|nr:OmpA family protein [Candidatus Sumerlaeia bacterium]